MVKKSSKTSVSEDDGEVGVVNGNGKRPFDSQDDNAKKRIRTRSLYRQPTVAELNRLHETENLFNSNLFRLQVEEVLQEVKVKDKVLAKFQTWFDKFKNSLLSIPDNANEYDLSEKTLFKQLKVKIPIGGEISRTKCNFKFHKFNDVEVVGSYKLGCAINSKLNIDLLITVPADTYTKNDSINYRYHKKRAAYLAYIASHIKTSDLIEDLQYSCVDSTESKPFIVVKPQGSLGKYFTVKILLSCEGDAYKLHRYSPSRNNLRGAWFFNAEDGESNSIVDSCTPYYNSSVLCDLTSSVNNQYLQETLENSDNLKQAIVLLKIWLRQRNMKVSGFVVSMFVAHLVQAKRINNIMSSYQIIRNVWISLKSSEWDTKGITSSKGESNVSTPPLEEFLRHFPVVFLDRSGYYNICWQMDIGTYNALRRESSLAVEMLDNPNINSFISLFMTSYKNILQFDHILRFTDISQIKESVYKKASTEQKLNYGVEVLPLIARNIHSLLSKGLGDRVELIVQQIESDFSWPVKRKHEKAKGSVKEALTFAFILNTEKAFDTVDKGPPANLPEAEQFRAFWGDKSELRRFQDGSITETCVWEADSLSEKRMLTKQIVLYLLDLKFGVKSGEVFYVGDQVESVLVCKQHAPTDGVVGTGEEDAVRIMHAYDDLRRDLRALTDLPLDINSVYGISPVFSYAEPFPTRAQGLTDGNPWKRGASCLIKASSRSDGLTSCPPYIAVSTAILELGHSGKWPGDLEAFRCLKAAFHLQIAESLTKQFSLPTQAHPTHVDVLKCGLVFRLEIAHTKEITLVKRDVQAGVVKHRDSEESVELQCRFALMPKLRGAMHGLHQRHPAYGPATSLLKRLLSCHLLDDYHFPHPVVELLTAAVFLAPEPLSPPAQPLAALARVLHMICTRDWTDVLLVNFNDELTRDQIMELEKTYSKSDSPRPAICIITPYDEEGMGSVWSRHAPTPHVLARVQILAKSTLNYLEENLLRQHKDNILDIFVPSMVGYDVLIHLHSALVPYSGERVDKKPVFKPLPPVGDAEPLIPVVEFNPVRKYLDELRSAYSEFALFFHDMYGGDVVAVLWRPELKGARDFHIVNAHALKPITVDGEANHEVNFDAIIDDFRIIGDGLVKNITVNV